MHRPIAIYAALKNANDNVYWYEGKAQNWGVLFCSYMNEEKQTKRFLCFFVHKVWYSEEGTLQQKKKIAYRLVEFPFAWHARFHSGKKKKKTGTHT